MKVRFLLDENISPKVRPDTSIRHLLQTLDLVSSASEAEDWINEMHWIPF
jgi:hypothetical protein